MNKELILEKITKEWKDSDVSPSRLASYLATLEERLEKKSCCCLSYEKGICPCLCGCHTPTPTEGETKHRCSTKCRVDCKLRAPTPTPPECEHKHRGLYGECLKCTAKFDDSPTEVKDWEDEFTQNWVGLKITPLVSDEIKSFIRNLLNK